MRSDIQTIQLISLSFYRVISTDKPKQCGLMPPINRHFNRSISVCMLVKRLKTTELPLNRAFYTIEMNFHSHVIQRTVIAIIIIFTDTPLVVDEFPTMLRDSGHRKNLTFWQAPFASCSGSKSASLHKQLLLNSTISLSQLVINPKLLQHPSFPPTTIIQ